MPKLVRAWELQDSVEGRQIRRLARRRHTPEIWMRRARIRVRSWEGLKVPDLALAIIRLIGGEENLSSPVVRWTGARAETGQLPVLNHRQAARARTPSVQAQSESFVAKEMETAAAGNPAPAV